MMEVVIHWELFRWSGMLSKLQCRFHASVCYRCFIGCNDDQCAAGAYPDVFAAGSAFAGYLWMLFRAGQLE